MKVDQVQQLGALAMVVLAMAVVAGLAWRGSEPAMGALISVVSAGAGFYLRAKVQVP